MSDYFNWHKREELKTQTYLHNGVLVDLAVESCKTINLGKRWYEVVLLLYNENNTPWLLYYGSVGGRFVNEDDSVAIKPEEFYVFEYIDGDWKFIKRFSERQLKGDELNEFLKKKYGLDQK